MKTDLQTDGAPCGAGAVWITAGGLSCRGTYMVSAVHMLTQFKLLKPKNRHPVKEVGGWLANGCWAKWQILWHVKPRRVTGHAIRAAMGTVWETWGVWPVWTGCVTGRPSGITSRCLPNTIWSHLFQDPLAFKTRQHSWPPRSHPALSPRSKCPSHWLTLHGYWPLRRFRSLALLSYDLHSADNTTPHALHVFIYWSAQHLLLPQRRCPGKGGEEKYEMMAEPPYKNTPAEKKMERHLTDF